MISVSLEFPKNEEVILTVEELLVVLRQAVVLHLVFYYNHLKILLPDRLEL